MKSTIKQHYEEFSNKEILYPNGQPDKIYKKGMCKGTCKNNNFSIGKVFYTPNIQNNLISIPYLL